LPDAGFSTPFVPKVVTGMSTVSIQLHIKRTDPMAGFSSIDITGCICAGCPGGAGAQDESLLFRHACITPPAEAADCVSTEESISMYYPWRILRNPTGAAAGAPAKFSTDRRPAGGFQALYESPGFNRLPLMRSAQQTVDSSNRDERIKRIQESQDQDLPILANRIQQPGELHRVRIMHECLPSQAPHPHFSGPALLAAAGRIAAEPRRHP